ncbi:MAG: STN domain-containing protein [Planctomycetia bacterium]|nr:STN domain-containing protein [Planctomycetia bacterium]
MDGFQYSGMRFFSAVLAFAALALPAAAVDEPPNLAAGTSFRSALEQPISPTWDHLDLRTIARTIESGQRVAVLVDRRLDPSGERSLKVSCDTLRECFDRLAAECDGGATVIGNVVYLGPRETAGKLRTLVAMRKNDLKELPLPESRRTAITRTRAFRWNDLDRPADVLRRLAEEYRLEVDGLDQVPHDLWAAAALPDATPIEALSLVLAQFELTFQWTEGARGVRIEPIPERVAIEKSYDPPRGLSPADAIARWQEVLPGLEARPAGGKVVVSGTEEFHEMVDRVRRGKRPDEKPGRSTAPLPALGQKRYFSKFENVPVSALMRELETPGQGLLTFEYDRAAFKAAGIDLDRRVSFELKNAKIEGFLKAAFDPIGVTFEIHDRTVRLKPVQK